MLYFYISSIKTKSNVKKYTFFTDQWQLVKSSRKFSAILEFFLGPTFPCSRTFLCPGESVHLLRHMGMCPSKGLLFHKKSLNIMVPFSAKISLNMGPFFQNCEKRASILRNIPQKGYLLLPKWSSKIGRGFEARAAHPRPNQIWVAPWLMH